MVGILMFISINMQKIFILYLELNQGRIYPLLSTWLNGLRQRVESYICMYKTMETSFQSFITTVKPRIKRKCGNYIGFAINL